MLNVCTNNHDEVVFEGHQCPFCIAIAEKDRAEETAQHLEAERDKLLAQLESVLQ